ncbi:MAG: RluA family pseudouridine synthase [Deltaproteobacteria bacterium]|nr:RluA family pseudouridine synthase [Deltaproteobacteria bacterium]
MRERCALSWTQARRLVRSGKVHVDGALVPEPSFIPPVGSSVSLDTDRRRPARRVTVDPSRILHRDPHLLVVDKPPGLVSVPPTPTGEATLLDQLVGLTGTPVFAVHRLDQGTSGLMVFACSAAAAQGLEELFRVHDVQRTYLALCHGTPAAPALWDDPVLVQKPDAPAREVPAVTRVLSSTPAGNAALLHLALATGRWHQVRLHAAAHGHPILGDREHGDPSRDRPFRPPRLALHSHTLALRHPVTGGTLDFTLPLPADLEALLRRIRTGASGGAAPCPCGPQA